MNETDLTRCAEEHGTFNTTGQVAAAWGQLTSASAEAITASWGPQWAAFGAVRFRVEDQFLFASRIAGMVSIRYWNDADETIVVHSTWLEIDGVPKDVMAQIATTSDLPQAALRMQFEPSISG